MQKQNKYKDYQTYTLIDDAFPQGDVYFSCRAPKDQSPKDLEDLVEALDAALKLPEVRQVWEGILKAKKTTDPNYAEYGFFIVPIEFNKNLENVEAIMGYANDKITIRDLNSFSSGGFLHESVHWRRQALMPQVMEPGSYRTATDWILANLMIEAEAHLEVTKATDPKKIERMFPIFKGVFSDDLGKTILLNQVAENFMGPGSQWLDEYTQSLLEKIGIMTILGHYEHCEPLPLSDKYFSLEGEDRGYLKGLATSLGKLGFSKKAFEQLHHVATLIANATEDCRNNGDFASIVPLLKKVRDGSFWDALPKPLDAQPKSPQGPGPGPQGPDKGQNS